ncbi:MAG: hypothetical protein J6B92_11090 [Paraprevotella sp.]|nr:hypothetical protein [Paraprevotella sp.]
MRLTIHHPNRLVLSLLFLSLFTHLLYAQTDNEALARLKGYARNVHAFNNLLPQEKVYLHFDNTSYFRGETIWFKAYVVRTDSARLTDLSRVLYVELVAPTGDVIQTRKLKIENGQARGDFKLDIPLIDNGWYEVRAYTRYMTNWDATGIFSRVFPIFGKELESDMAFLKEVKLDTATEASFKGGAIRYGITDMMARKEWMAALDKQKGKNKKDSTNNIQSVDFYPEGGHLVKGLPTRMAFSLNVKENGKRDRLRGALFSDSGDSIGYVDTDIEGRGMFDYQPSKPVSSLSFREKNGNRLEFALPKPEDSGCAAHVDAVTDSLNMSFTLRCTEDWEGYLFGWTILHEGNVLRFDTIRLQHGVEKRVDIPRNRLRTGVNQLTLFNQEGRILAERLFFIHPTEGQDTEHIHITTPDTIRPYGKMDFICHTKPGRTFSLSVLDADKVTEDAPRGNVRSWLLLSSDLKGFIRNPEQYLENNDSIHRAMTDRLMMVQGWRRYDWQTMAGKKTFVKKQPLEDGLYIDGRIKLKHSENNPGKVGIDLVLMNPEKKHQWIAGEKLTQEDGWFAFKVENDIEGRWGLVINTKKTSEDKEEKAHNYRVLLDRHFAPELRAIPWEETRLHRMDTLLFPPIVPAYEPYDSTLFTVKKNRILKEVVVKEKKRRRKEFSWTEEDLKQEQEKRKERTIYYDCEKIVDDLLDKGEDILPTNSWIRALPHIRYVTEIENRDVIHLVFGNVPATPSDKGNGYLPSAVRDLRNVRSIYIYFQIGDEKINWVLKPSLDPRVGIGNNKFDDERLNRAILVYIFPRYSFPLKKKGIRQTYFQGYNRPETFKMNNYSEMEPVEDHRRTLYWNPDITTDATGSTTVTIWNSTSCRKLYLSAEGITQEGIPIIKQEK